MFIQNMAKVSNNKVLLCVLKQFLRARLQTAHESCFNQELRQKMLLKGREAKKKCCRHIVI